MSPAERKFWAQQNRRDERAKVLTNRLSGLTDTNPASGPREVPEWRLGPYSDEPELESDAHLVQNFLLRETLDGLWADRKDYFAGVNMSVWYPVTLEDGTKERRKLKFRGPDFFVALNAEPIVGRRSWVVENEGKYPDVIVEVLSSSTKRDDRGNKKQIYEQIFKTHEYFLYDPDKQTLDGFRLVDGRYAPIAPNEQGRLWSEKLELFLGLVDDQRLQRKVTRYFTPDGTMVPTGREAAKEAQAKVAREREARAHAEAMLRQQANDERHRADEERQRAELERAERLRVEAERERLARKLRELGVDPDKLE